MKKIFYSVLFVALTMSSCNEDRIDEEAEFGPMDEFYNDNKPEEQEFEITSEDGGPIIGKEGTKLYGGRSILMHANTNDVSLPYTIKLIELYSYKDMILYNMPTTSSGNVTESGGEIKVTAFKDGEELFLKPNMKYAAVLSTTPTKTGMSVYDGTHPNNVFSNWTLNASSMVVDSSGLYGLLLSKLGWQNCAQSTSFNAHTDIEFTIDGKGGEFIDIFIVFNDFHGLIQGSNLTASKVPVGANATILAMAKDQNGDFRLHNQTLTITQDLKIKLDMKVVSEAALLNVLGNL